jgi:hypothetical protein
MPRFKISCNWCRDTLQQIVKNEETAIKTLLKMGWTMVCGKPLCLKCRTDIDKEWQDIDRTWLTVDEVYECRWDCCMSGADPRQLAA